MERKDFEIMAPVGSYESLSAAIAAGADAVYFGVEGLNMRARSSVNFTLDDLRRIASICNEAGVKTYLTVNTIIYDNEIDKCREVIDAVSQSGITAIIASDIAAIEYARSIGVEVHISTQVNVSNTEDRQILLPMGRRHGTRARTIARPGRSHPPCHHRARHPRPQR